MPRPRTIPYQALAVAAGFLALLWILPAGVRSFGRATFHEFQAPTWTTAAGLRDLQTFWSLRLRSRDELIEAGRNLARLNASYEVKLQQIESLEREVARLEALLALPSWAEYRTEVARVVRRDLDTWSQQVVIRKGRRDGLSVGLAAIHAGGVAGRVREVRETTAVVELVSSRGFRMAAHLAEDGRPVTYRGSTALAFGLPGGLVANVPAGVVATADAPRRLVSSRLGGVFPDGLTIGWIDRLEPGSDGLFQEGTVRLDPALLELSELAILVPLDPAGRPPEP